MGGWEAGRPPHPSFTHSPHVPSPITTQVLAPFGDDSNAPSEAEAEATQGWEVTGPLSCMALAGSTVAAGGKERELGLWDAATGQAVWEARNVAHDSLDLRQPVWVTAASFLDEGARTVAVGTAYKQVRVYDARAQRRPVREAVALGDGGYRVTALCPGREPGAHLVTGDAGGTVVHLDVGTLRVLGRMEGPAGSVRGLARHPDGSGGHSFVAVAGLDRVARVYDLRRPRKEAHRFYLKQRLTAVLFAPEGRRGSKGKADAEAERRARVRAGGVDEEEVEGMEDDVGSFDGGEGSSDDEEGGFGEEEEEEESEGRSGGGGGKRKKAGAGMSYQRVYDDDESEGEDGGALEGEESEDQEEEEEEAHVPFGRRGDAGANNIELNIAGLDEEEEESSDEGEDEDEEADEESSEEDEELEPAPAPAVATKRARRR